MDKLVRKRLIDFYTKGYTIRELAQIPGVGYQREQIRKELKKAGIPLRGRATTYRSPLTLAPREQVLLAELLGYLYGDGSVHKNKNTRSGLYDCNLTFSLDEEDLVRRVSFITNSLFGCYLTSRKKKDMYYLKFRRSIAKYIHSLGYPAGKKSVINPQIPKHLLLSKEAKQAFTCGFLNAEATVNKSVSVQQSVRLDIPEKATGTLKQAAKAYIIRNKKRYFVRWNIAKKVLDLRTLPQSNMLLGIQYLLKQMAITSTIYPIRVYIGQHAGLHYELRVKTSDLGKIRDRRLLTCRKKAKALNLLLREWQSGQMRKLQELVP